METRMEEITNKILEDFSLKNYKRLFKSDASTSNCSVWWVLKKDRISPCYISDSEKSYCLQSDGSALWVGGFEDILDGLYKGKIIDQIKKLDHQYDLDIRFEREQRKNTFLLEKLNIQ